MTELCPNCRNPVQKNSTVCIYCQAPLTKPESPAVRRPLAISRYIVPLIFVAFAFAFLYPRIKPLFVNESEKISKERQIHKKTRSSEIQNAGGYIDEVTGLDAYRNLENAIRRSDAEQARRYVTNKRWKELELESERPNAIEELNAGCPVETEFESHDKNQRTVLIAKGKSELVKDHGNPALKVLIVKLAKEEGQWKVFSLECHHLPPADYMEEALSWLDEQPVQAGQDLNSKLQAEGLRFGAQSCFNAIDEGNALAVKRCLVVGWDPNTTDSSNRHAIDTAIFSIARGSPADREILMALINAGADINATGVNGMTPLMMAARHCKVEIVRDLIQSKAKLNIKNSEGITALGMAENCPEATDLLVQSGARK